MGDKDLMGGKVCYLGQNKLASKQEKRVLMNSSRTLKSVLIFILVKGKKENVFMSHAYRDLLSHYSIT